MMRKQTKRKRWQCRALTNVNGKREEARSGTRCLYKRERWQCRALTRKCKEKWGVVKSGVVAAVG